jgi:hypothetical protein
MAFNVCSRRAQAMLAWVKSEAADFVDRFLATVEARAAATAARVMSASPASNALAYSGCDCCSLLSSCSVFGDVHRPDLIAASRSGGRSSSAR